MADSSKQEEERIQRAMNRKGGNRSSMLVKSGNEEPVQAPVQPVHPVRAPVSTPSYRQSMNVKGSGVERPKPTSAVASPSQTSHSSEIESLQMKKRTLLGTIVSTKRDLEEVRNEIAKLKNKEAELVALMEKREHSVHQLTQEIEALEQRDLSEENKRKEDEKARRIKEEIERRRKEEEAEERKKIEDEEKKILNPQPVYAPRALSSESLQDDGLNAEELRLMRAMSRPTKVAGTGRTSAYKSSSNIPKPQSDPDRVRLAEENKRREEESRLQQERQLQERIAHLQHPGGVSKTFVSPQIYDFDAEVKFCADFTKWEEVPITTPIDNNFTHSVVWQVSPGYHFYLFKINGKAEINKHLPTGLAPNGQLMNKIEC
jgi:myosin heavy subunit